MPRYEKPDWLTKNVFNPAISFDTRLGLSMRGSRVLVVRGRKTGQPHSNPVNPLTVDGARYLVAPRGDTHWSRNLRAAGEGELRLGRKTEPFRAEEIADDAKPPLLREYLKRWKMETAKFFEGVTDASPDEEIRRIAPNHPVFRISGE